MHLGAGRPELNAAAERRRKVEGRQLEVEVAAGTGLRVSPCRCTGQLAILENGGVRGRQHEARAARGDVTERLQRVQCAQQ